MRKTDYQMQTPIVRVWRWTTCVVPRAIAAVLLLGWWTLMLCPTRPPHTFPSGYVMRHSRKKTAAGIWTEQMSLAHASMGNWWNFEDIIADLMAQEEHDV